MEAALKEVFKIHRSVVRDCRNQLQAEVQKNKELQQELAQNCHLLKGILFTLIDRYNKVCATAEEWKCLDEKNLDLHLLQDFVRGHADALKNESSVLEQQVTTIASRIFHGSPYLKEAFGMKSPSQGDGDSILSSEQPQPADQSDRTLRAVRNALNKSQENEDPPQLEDSHKVLTAQDVTVEKAETAENVLSEIREKVKVFSLDLSDHTNSQAVMKTVLEQLSRRVPLGENAQGRSGFENLASQKSPESGPKLQLTRNATKRRRYTEDDSIGKSKAKRLHADSKTSVASKKGDGRDSGTGLPSDRLSTTPSQSAESRNKGSDLHKITGVETTALLKTKHKSSSHAEDDTEWDAGSSPFHDPDGNRKTGSDNDYTVTRVPETLAVDLSMIEAEGETEVQDRTSPVGSGDDSPADLQGKQRKTSDSSAHGRSFSSSYRKGSGGEECDNTQDRSVSKTGDRTSVPNSWPTDSVVFGSAGPRLARGRRQEPPNTSSVYIDEGQQSADCASPVFLTDFRELQHGDQSPTLFDESDSDEDSQECTPTATVLNAGHRPSKLSDRFQSTAVSLTSPALLQVVQTTSKGASADFNSSIEHATSLHGDQTKREIYVLSTPRVTKERVNKRPHPFQNPSLCRDADVAPQSDLTLCTDLTTPAAKKSGKVPSPSADDTINPCLLEESTIYKGVGGKRSSGGEQRCQVKGRAVYSQLNASLDPAVRLTQYLAEQTPKEDDEEDNEAQDVEEDGDVTLDPRFLRAHQTSGQDVTMLSLSSSDPYTDMPPSLPVVALPEAARPAAEKESLEDSFDRVPRKKSQPSYAFKEVVRKKSERQKLNGFDCKECRKYYQATGGANEAQKRMGECSRHRGQQARSNTPEHFFSPGFPNTQEWEERKSKS